MSGTLGILVLGFVVAALPQIGVAPNIVGLAFGLVLGSLAASWRASSCASGWRASSAAERSASGQVHPNVRRFQPHRSP
ncbi:hypothetical protein [Cyanobium sp. ATX 6A2]|uniref:hypothetical protein n=1 Tax=Cyanobium sp. ATX 6A2 TaxID=2823700 RepID=UPI0020CD2360|nr:hypothetical protein [Cyanobium sp. ATX 6A2]